MLKNIAIVFMLVLSNISLEGAPIKREVSTEYSKLSNLNGGVIVLGEVTDGLKVGPNIFIADEFNFLD